MARILRSCVVVAALLLLSLQAARAGVTNPDISLVGQMRVFVNNDRADENRARPQFSFDESEVVADAALNPYAHGTFIIAFASDEVGVEEGYLTIVRGLPSGLAFKAGKYRVGFGRLNPVHPHAYPFVERFRVLAEYLPGEESFNETGAQLSYRLPLPGDINSTISTDVLQGATFHPEESGARAAFALRSANFFMLSDASSMEIGLSYARGVNHVEYKTASNIAGIDAKAKLALSPLSALVLQAEALLLDRDTAALDTVTSEVSRSHLRPLGGYLFADFLWKRRYEAGLTFERYQQATPEKPWNQAFGAFAGLALMEETTLFRLNWNRFEPEDAEAFSTLTAQVVFSMGPHKPHQF